MKPFLVLPFSGGGSFKWTTGAIDQIISALPPASTALAAAKVRFLRPAWAVTLTAAHRPTLHLVGPGEQSENQEEDENDLELESDEDHSKLRMARTRPGAEDGSPAAKGDDGTINPPFP